MYFKEIIDLIMIYIKKKVKMEPGSKANVDE